MKSQVFPGITMVQGDLEDRDSLAAAMRGPRPPGSTRRVVVFFISTPCLASGGYAVDAEKEAFAGCALVDAAVETKVDHLVFSSVANCDRKGAPSYHRSKHRIEEKVKKSGISFTILRPVSFFEVWARLSQFSVVSISGLVKRDVKQQWVALDDVGATGALALVDASKFAGRTLDLVGEECTGDDMAAALTKLRATSSGEKIVYKCAWFMRLFMMYFVRSIYEVAFSDLVLFLVPLRPRACADLCSSDRKRLTSRSRAASTRTRRRSNPSQSRTPTPSNARACMISPASCSSTTSRASPCRRKRAGGKSWRWWQRQRVLSSCRLPTCCRSPGILYTDIC